MPAERSCSQVESRLVEALLSRSQPEAADRAHAADCTACGPLLARLRALATSLGTSEPREPPTQLAEATLLRAGRELARPVAVERGVPEGYRADCLRLLGGALLPFPLVVAWNLALLMMLEGLLAAWLPPSAVTLIGIAYLLAAAGWLALLYGSIPILAHRRAQRRLAEVP